MSFGKRNIAGIIKRHPQIELIYLFGSKAKRPRTKARDIDIAILFSRVPKGVAELDLRVKLEKDLKTSLGGPVDLVFLNTAPVALKQQVLKYGNLLFERRKGLHNIFFAATVSAYFDYLYLLKFFAIRLPRARKASSWSTAH